MGGQCNIELEGIISLYHFFDNMLSEFLSKLGGGLLFQESPAIMFYNIKIYKICLMW